MGNCGSYNEIAGSQSARLRWGSDESIAGSLRRKRKSKSPSVSAIQTLSTKPSPNSTDQESTTKKARHKPFPEPLTATQVADVLRRGEISTLTSMNHCNANTTNEQDSTELVQLADVLEHDRLRSTYTVQQLITQGTYWTLWRVVRINDKKQMLIKKISKDKIPVEEQYFQACENNSACQCSKCDSVKTSRPPIELVLLQSKDSGLPQLVDSCEDDNYYYIVTKLHGPSRKRWKNASSWFGRGRWSTVYWREYLT
ncbi:hypothetical protein BDV3_004762 [Batrachochytrium dendrobatidis]